MLRDIQGAVAVTVTPFLSGVTPDHEEIRRQTELLCQSGIDGIFPCSSTGEYPKMLPEDKLRVMETVAEVNAGRKFLIAGACAVSTEEIKLYIDKAKALRYDACLICPPFYYPLKQTEILTFYREICAYAGDMRVLAYNVPFFTTGIELDTFDALLDIPNLTGMKDSSGNLKKITHECDLAAAKRPDFILYTGTDDCLLPSLIAGCRGSMTALGAIFPNTVKRIYDTLANGQLAEAQRIQKSLLPLLRLADRPAFPAGYKLLAQAAGTKIGNNPGLSDPALGERLLADMTAILSQLHLN